MKAKAGKSDKKNCITVVDKGVEGKGDNASYCCLVSIVIFR